MPSDDFSQPPFGLLPRQAQQAAGPPPAQASALLPPFLSHAASLASTSASTAAGRAASVAAPTVAAANIDSMSVIDEALNLLAYDAAQVRVPYLALAMHCSLCCT